MNFIICENIKTSNEYTSDSSLSLLKHPDDIYVVDILREIDNKRFKGVFIDSAGVKLPQSQLTNCLNELRLRSEAELDSKMRGLSVNVLASWANIKTEMQYQQ